MGILDDAIRQHLELKRQHGAEGDDLERLEKEAFGPATRPGDPEFADPAQTASPPEAATTIAPASEADSAPPTPAPPAEDTADHPGPQQLGPADEAEEAPAPAPEPTPATATSPTEPTPPEAPERSIFDAEDIDFADFDLELDEPEKPAAAERPPVEAPLPPEPASPPRIESPPETGPGTPPAPIAPPPEPVAPPIEEGSGAKAADEDLLEETPDFLQDAPEGEDLWFEQGPPRDFDFDDDDD
ncbi:MAG: hypothetical protein ABIZ50_00185 [Solirubrobacterales bacterium]